MWCFVHTVGSLHPYCMKRSLIYVSCRTDIHDAQHHGKRNIDDKLYIRPALGNLYQLT